MIQLKMQLDLPRIWVTKIYIDSSMEEHEVSGQAVPVRLNRGLLSQTTHKYISKPTITDPSSMNEKNFLVNPHDKPSSLTN